MATPPTAPVIRHAPKASPNTLEYFWYPPQSQGSAPLTGYRLTLQPGNLVYTTGVTNYTMVTGLTNAVTYQTTIEATNDSGATYGPPASFREFQPGSPPQVSPSTVAAAAVQPNAAVVSWTAPQTLPDATIFWYVVTGISSNAADPVISTNGYALSQSNVFITGLNSNSSYYFNVRAVNCPGYSPPLATNTIVWVTAPTAFSPTQLSGLQLWLDAADSTTITSSNNAISQWNDKSGRGYNVTQGTSSNQPTYSASMVSLNSNRYFNIPQAAINNATQYCYFMVFTPNSGSNWITVKQRDGVDTMNVWSMTYYTQNAILTGSNGYMYYRTGNGNTLTNSGVALTRSNMQIITMAYTTTTNTLSMFVNGSTLTASNGNFVIPNELAANRFTLGAIVDGAGTIYNSGVTNFNLYEFGFYNIFTTPFDRQKVEGYLAWKWGLQTSLPTTHPFYISQPLSNTVFTPTLFPGLQFWLDATQLTGFTNGQTLSTWTDKTSNAYVGTAVNGPTYRTSTINTYPSVRFNGTNQYVDFGNILNIGTNPGLAIFSLIKFNTATNAGIVNKTLFGPGTGRWAQWRDSGNIGTFVSLDNTAPPEAKYVDSSTTPMLLETAWNRQTISIFKNATQQGASVASVSAANLTNIYKLLVAAYNDGTGLAPQAGYYYNGEVSEVLVYNRALSTDDRQTVEGYLLWKYGLQGNLPTAHPYKFMNPAVNYTTSMIVPQGLLVNFTATSYSGSGTWTNVAALGTNADATIESGTPSKNAAGNGVVLNGSTGFTFPDISLGNAWSVSLWVKHTSLPFSSAASWVTQIGVGGVINVMIYGNFSVVGGNAGPSQISGGFYNGATLTNPTALSITPNIWYHLTWTWNGSSLTFYISGVLNSAITSANVASSSGFNYRIGRSYDGSSYMTGEIGQALIYNRAITASEVLQNYNATASTYTV